MTEYWDVLDKNMKVIGRMRRGEPGLGPTRFHLTVEVIPTDCKGYMLVTQRSFKKNYGAGLFEFPAGSVISGETPERAAVRELFEETGLKASKLRKLQTARIPGLFRITYLAEIPDLRTQEIRLQPKEAISYRIVTVQEWYELMAHQQFDAHRSQMYGAKLLKMVDELVGLLPKPAPKEPPLGRLVRRESLFDPSQVKTSGETDGSFALLDGSFYEEE